MLAQRKKLAFVAPDHKTEKQKYSRKYYFLPVSRGNKTEGKMTLTVDAAGAAFNSSTTTVSGKWPRPLF